MAADFRFHAEVARATQNHHFLDLMHSLGTGVIPRVRLEINDPMAASDGPVQLTLPWRASKDSSTATQIRFITLNGNAGTLYSA